MRRASETDRAVAIRARGIKHRGEIAELRYSGNIFIVACVAVPNDSISSCSEGQTKRINSARRGEIDEAAAAAGGRGGEIPR